jgi:predicted dehydrogenase
MYNAAIIGLGQIGLMYDFEAKRLKPASHTLAYEMNPDIQLVAAHDTRAEQELLLKQLAPTTIFFQDLRSLYSTQDIDIISICTPPNQHLVNLKEIFKYSAPKVIFCEKPVVSDLEQCLEIEAMLENSRSIFIPNLSRRWNEGTDIISNSIQSKKLGKLKKLHAKYTRGIYNTGSHMVDLINLFAGKMKEVRVCYQVPTSADVENDPSFTFQFYTECDVQGFAEAFDDRHYYIFEMDLFFESGKIEFRLSGDQIRIYHCEPHPLFSAFAHLEVQEVYNGLLTQSNLERAVSHIVQVLGHNQVPICSFEDGIYPIVVADALLRSYHDQGKIVGI